MHANILSVTSPIVLTDEQREQLRNAAARLHPHRRAAFLGIVQAELALRQSDNVITNRQLATAINFGLREVLRGWMT
jgi:hypothetical protein